MRRGDGRKQKKKDIEMDGEIDGEEERWTGDIDTQAQPCQRFRIK